MQLASAMEHAHAHGVVHRDIKPANIMMEADDGPRLLDFGLAQQLDSTVHLTHAGDVLGTPAYMPPEPADGRAWQADPRSDIYSLGVLLFQLTCHRLPFQGPTADVIHQLIHQTPPGPRRINPRVNRDLQTIILKCLEKDPSDRYQNAGALAADLQRYSEGMPITARPVSLGGRTLKWARRKPILAGLSAALLLMLAFVVGISTQLRAVGNERDRAQSAEQKAKNAEIKMTRLLATEAAAAGQLAMQRGQLDRAIQYFEQSLDCGYESPLELRLLKLDALVGTRQKEKACAELYRILDDDDHTSRMSDVLIWKGELALDGFSEFGEPADLFQRARNQSPDPVSAQYVRAMLAESSVEALDGFRKTLMGNHFHHRARRMLIIMLLSLGRVDEAAGEIGIGMELYPDDPDFQLFKAIVFSHRADLDGALKILQQLDSIDTQRWTEFCKVVDRVANHLVVSQEKSGFQPQAIRQAAQEFSEVCVPLMRKRGRHFPPGIGRKLAGLPDVLATHRNQDTIQSVVERLRAIVKIHPEGSLYGALAEALITLQNIRWESTRPDLKAIGPAISLEALDAIEKANRNPAFVQSVREGNPDLEFSCALVQALVFEEDIENNKKKMADSALRMSPSSITAVNSLRSITIGLLNAGETRAAVPFADRWIQIAGEDSYEAAWNRLMCDWHDQQWLNVVKRCQQIKDRFPDNEELEKLLDAATREINKTLEPPGNNPDQGDP